MGQGPPAPPYDADLGHFGDAVSATGHFGDGGCKCFIRKK